MEIIIQNSDRKPALSIIILNGDLDGSNYQEVIHAAKQAQENGAKYLLIDMENVPFMGSAGLVALHSIALLMQGKELPNPDDGWSALHTMGSDAQAGMQPY
ncbi:MAG TPA: STAS domain-containing protein, partial [Aggregatilineales bacterium]|nr:STAS domain-containing protein [Aggregatilineales bacterium]